MMTPTIHLNGTSREELARQLEEAGTALFKVFNALEDAAPNARDYYPQGYEAIDRATQEHQSRLERVRSVYAEIQALYEHVQDV